LLDALRCIRWLSLLDVFLRMRTVGERSAFCVAA
jgi:hypothetical protein